MVDRLVGLIANIMPGIMLAACIIFIVGMTGCATPPRGSFCDVAEPHRFSDSAVDAMSDAEVTAALAHNLKGAALCDWEP